MKNEIVSQSNSHQSPRTMRGTRGPVATLMAVVALIAFASSSAFAQQCEPVDFAESGNFPNTIYVTLTTGTSGATIFATVGNSGVIPGNPTHNGGTPTGSTFICTAPIVVLVHQHKWIKAIAYRSDLTDSDVALYEVDNTGN